MDDVVSMDPQICGGKPCIRGARIMVHQLVSMVSAGMSIEDIVADYPELTQAQIAAALDWAADVIEHHRAVLVA